MGLNINLLADIALKGELIILNSDTEILFLSSPGYLPNGFMRDLGIIISKCELATFHYKKQIAGILFY